MMIPARRRALNSYSQSLADALQAQGVEVVDYSLAESLFGHHQIVHLHWPEHFTRGASRPRQFRRFMRGVRVLGPSLIRRRKIVWTVHNVEPHTAHSPRLWRLMRRVLASQAALTIHLTPASYKEMVRRGDPCANLPHVVIPHGVYEVPAVLGTGSKLRGHLAANDTTLVLAFVGRLLPYKGVESLIEVFRGIEAKADWRLVIAGEPMDDDYAESLAEAASADPKITLKLRRISDEDLGEILRGADFVVLPYRKVLNSGAALHALSFGTPVVLPRTETFKWLRDAVGGEWVRLFDELTPSSLAEATNAPPTASPDLTQFEWSTIGRETTRAYRLALSGSRAESTPGVSGDAPSSMPGCRVE